MISHSHKFVFIHIPKCAGISVESCLPTGLYKNHHLNLRSYALMEGQSILSYFKFCLVRNPWDKIVSLYFFWKSQTQGHPFYQWDHNQADFINNNKLSFDDFVNEVAQGNSTFTSREHLRPYHYYTEGVDFVGKYESIQEDFDYACDKIGIATRQLPHKNKSKHEHYSTYYNDRTIDIVAEIYSQDITDLDYQFNP